MMSDPYRWLTPLLAFAFILIYLDWQNSLRALLIGGFGAILSDTLNTRLIKKHTDRIRPSKQYPDVRVLGIMNSGRKSFPSNHASNTMSFAIGFGLIFPWTWWLLLPLVFLVGYSRIYCGAHFPLDVIAGWLIGLVWTLVGYSLITCCFI